MFDFCDYIGRKSSILNKPMEINLSNTQFDVDDA